MWRCFDRGVKPLACVLMAVTLQGPSVWGQGSNTDWTMRRLPCVSSHQTFSRATQHACFTHTHACTNAWLLRCMPLGGVVSRSQNPVIVKTRSDAMADDKRCYRYDSWSQRRLLARCALSSHHSVDMAACLMAVRYLACVDGSESRSTSVVTSAAQFVRPSKDKLLVLHIRHPANVHHSGAKFGQYAQGGTTLYMNGSRADPHHHRCTGCIGRTLGRRPSCGRIFAPPKQRVLILRLTCPQSPRRTTVVSLSR